MYKRYNTCFAVILSVLVLLSLALLCFSRYNVEGINLNKHTCYFDKSHGESTTTCKTLGETSYPCIYSYDEIYNCKKRFVEKDTEYAPCSYEFTETLNENGKTVNVFTCKWCGAKKFSVTE